MPKFTVFASETVYYMTEVEADSTDQVREMIYKGEVDFGYSDITDGADFTIGDIEENENA